MRPILLSIAVLSLAQPALPQATSGSAADSAANSAITSLIDGLTQTRTPTSVSISPDGDNLAWAYDGQHGSEVHVTHLAGGSTPAEPDRVISPDTIANLSNSAPGSCTASHPNWSPDGKQLAFLSNCSSSDGNWQANPQDNIFVWTRADNGVKQVSHLHGMASSIQWSPDGKSIGFLYVEGATRRAGALDAMKPWSGVYGEDGVEVQRVAAVTVPDLKPYDELQDQPKASTAEQPMGNRGIPLIGLFNFLSPPNLHAYEYAWSPDSRHIMFTGAKPPGENNWWVAKLYEDGYMGSDAPRMILDPDVVTGSLHGLQIAVPRFSPDGKQIAFIGGLMSDQGSIGGDVYLIPATGGEPRDITPNRPASPAYIAWLTDRYLGVSEHVGGSSHLTALDSTTGKDVSAVNLTLPETIIAGTDVMSISIALHSRHIALIRQSFEHPPEVWAGPVGNLKQITHLNDAIKPSWGKAESIDYTNDGFHIQGWLLYPSNYDPTRKYPLIVSVHGGPSSAATPRWPGVMYGPIPFSALGYFVFMPNPRGSYGQGEKFTQANVKDFGYGDLRDVLAGVDIIEKRFPIDKDREGITGWSYGGFMTMFTVTQTTRFKAAVSGAGIANWQSYYGENSIDQWMTPFFGSTVYDDPAVYAKSSPINFIKQVKTPTLVVVGDRDGECPPPQSFEFWHALREQGVKTELVIYPNEGHRFVDPAHQRDVLKRALDWFQSEMPLK
ncbi:MAG: S9 family peptidase [Acidobacteriota bacterium]|nr:S9 family peptidase [Acidobacteriota bacterium]